MPMDRSKYPDNWEWLSRQVIADAGNKCELCYAPNGEFIVRFPPNEYKYPWVLTDDMPAIEFSEGLEDSNYKVTKVVLTVHHINGDKNDSRKQNLIALCQKCHLRLDLLRHMENRKKNKNRNQTELNITA